MTKPDKKIFPIRKGVACQLKWTWNTISLRSGITQSCHRVVGVPLELDNFDNFHNYPTWIKHRELLLEGIFPDQGCQYCGDIEKAGGTSDRMQMANMENMYPPELDTDPLATHVTPRILEVFLDNTCNLACVYCGDSYSSRIEKENKKFGSDFPGIPQKLKSIRLPRSDNHEQLTDKFFLYLEKNYSNLRRLHILGGEPFYQKSFPRLIEFVKNNNNPNLELNIVTNLMGKESVIQQFVNDMKKVVAKRKLKRLDITASIDGYGKSEEYVRYGLDIDHWKKNFEMIASNKWIYLSVNSTITSLTIHNMSSLIDYVKSVSIKTGNKINHEFGFVVGHPQLHPKIFGPGLFDKYFEEIIFKLTKLFDKEGKEKAMLDYISGIKNLVDTSTENLEYQYYLKLTLEEYDRRRGTNWKENFPHLVKKLESLTKPV